MKKKNRKYLLFLGILLVVIIIFACVGFFGQNSQQTSNQAQNRNSLAANGAGQNNLPSVTFAPPASSPSAAALQFYEYYFSSPSNPLANGAFKNNPYLSSDFKQVIGALYNNGNEPVFCPNNKETNVTVSKEQQLYYGNQYLTDEIISETSPVSKDLYRVRLENVNGKWLIFDINCIP